MNSDEVQKIINKGEDYNRELKEAKETFNKDKDLPDYCAALANEGGGYLILGVKDNKIIVGTKAFTSYMPKLPHYLYQRLKIRINIHEVKVQEKRLVIFEVPSRNIGEIIRSNGHYHAPMRLGESLQEMDDRTMRDILNETLEDFSGLRSNASLADIDQVALDRFLKRYCEKHGRDRSLIDETQLLKDIKLIDNRRLTYTGLLLIGKQEAITSIVPQAEIIFEWRQSPDKVNYDYRNSWRLPLLLSLDEIWEKVEARNIRIPFQEGLMQREIVAFDEKSVREAVLNAVTHRDYRVSSESIFIKASPEGLEVTSPGGFVAGVSAANAIDKSAWRNRRLAEALQQLGFVERSGQGLDDIFLNTIRDGKGQPILTEKEGRQVLLCIPAMVKDVEFIKFLERLANEKHIDFTPREMLALEEMRTQGFLKEPYNKNKLLDSGVIERIGRGKGVKYLLSGNYYIHADKKGVHTRLVGASRAAKKQLILDHVERHSKVYNYELQDAFPDMTMQSISALLGELSDESKIRHEGGKRYGYWVSNTN